LLTYVIGSIQFIYRANPNQERRGGGGGGGQKKVLQSVSKSVGGSENNVPEQITIRYLFKMEGERSIFFDRMRKGGMSSEDRSKYRLFI
jgi:hypothetical protein